MEGRFFLFLLAPLLLGFLKKVHGLSSSAIVNGIDDPGQAKVLYWVRVEAELELELWGTHVGTS